MNYQIIKILGNCFRNINCFQFWSISNIDTTTTHPYSFPAIFVEFLHRHLCRISLWPTETSLQDNHCHVLHHFSYFPDLIWPHATIIGYTKPYAKPMLIKFIVKLYTNHNTLLVKHATYQKAESLGGASLSKLDTMSILTPSSIKSVQNYLQNGMCFFISQSYLCIQPSLQPPTKIHYPISAIFYIAIRILLAHKTIFAISTNTLFLYTTAIFHLPIFTYNHPYNLHQKNFPFLTNEVGSLVRNDIVSTDPVLISHFLLRV